VLKKQFSLAPNVTTSTTENTRPPRKRQAASIIDYDSDASTDATSTTTTVTTSTTNQNNSQPTTATPHNHNQEYANELQSIKMEINALKTMIADAVAQFKTAIASLTAPHLSSDMDTDAANHPAHHNNNTQPNDLGDIIQDLKYKLANIIKETRAMFSQQLLLMSTNHRPPPAVT